MPNEPDLETWLIATNERYGDASIPHRARPLLALRDYSAEYHCSFTHSSPIAKRIVSWFDSRGPKDALSIGPLFTGAFYFDAFFWPLTIPIAYGRISLDVMASLETMPVAVKAALAVKKSDHERLARYWIDCCDYAFGLEDVFRTAALVPQALDFLRNADRELNGALSQLTIPRPNSKALLALRLCVEIAMKVLLIQEFGLKQRDLMSRGHAIGQIARECFVATEDACFQQMSQRANLFPDVSKRYDGPDWSLSNLREAVELTQSVCAAVVRRYSGRDLRPQLVKEVQRAHDSEAI